jgi:DNA-binding XRE family transcriptional regulator
MSRRQRSSNKLAVFRHRMGLTQEAVAHLLGQPRTAMVSSYENGRTLPPLLVALRLSIIFRVPVEFLFGDLYDDMRQNIRAEEDRIAASKVEHTTNQRAYAP